MTTPPLATSVKRGLMPGIRLIRLPDSSAPGPRLSDHTLSWPLRATPQRTAGASPCAYSARHMFG
jgi:hypothetical protein